MAGIGDALRKSLSDGEGKPLGPELTAEWRKVSPEARLRRHEALPASPDFRSAEPLDCAHGPELVEGLVAGRFR